MLRVNLDMLQHSQRQRSKRAIHKPTGSNTLNSNCDCMSEQEPESPVLEKQAKPKKKGGKKKEDQDSQFQPKKATKMKDEEENDSDTKSAGSAKKKKKGGKKEKVKEKKAPAKTKASREPKEKAADEKGKKKAAQPPQKGGKQPMIKEDAESLLQYMKEMNRPFTLNYLKDTLFLKAALLGKNLEQLQKNGDIVLKEVGASKVFLINQSHFPEVPAEEMDKLGRELGDKSELLKAANAESNRLNDQLKQITRIMKLSEMEDEINRHQILIHEIDEKMNIYQSDTFVKANEEEVNQIETDYRKMAEISLKRKRIYERAIDTLLEGSEMTVKEFEAIIGVQRD